ncbi:MAG: hypothetical protein MJ189_04550 [Coriobacteriales bacterium]|nr:hypothetical protein [Coriobacteriales bacterium]
MRNRFRKFMIGRYGVDDYTGQLGFYFIVCLIISVAFTILRGFLGDWAFWVGQAFQFIAFGFAIYILFRTFSKNIPKRTAENTKFAQRKAQRQKRLQKSKNKKEYLYLSCDHCNQEMRVPRGKGKIAVTCPKCGERKVVES